MSTLQISLIILAVLAVAGLSLHNWWQERKYRKQWGSTFGRPAASVGEWRDPVDDLVISGSEEPVDGFTLSEPVLVPVATPARDVEKIAVNTVPVAVPVPDLEQRNRDLPPAQLDTLLEFGIMMHTVDAVPSSAFTNLIEGQRTDGKQTRWLGYAEQQDKWIEISPWRHQEFTDVMVAVQLTDRQGAVTEADLRQISEDVRQLAGRFNGVATWEDIAPVSVRAAKLDRFCVEVDVLIGLNVVSGNGQAFSGATVAQAAADAGLQLDSTGVYHRRNDRNDILYTLCNHEDAPFVAEQMETLFTHGVTLLFEVPRIDHGVTVFAEMARFGQQLAEKLGGRLVDDNIRPLSASGLEKIQAQLVHIYQQMEAGQIPAGSKRAMRLFN